MHDLVGSWKDLRIGKHRTTATLDLLPKGVSPAVDLIHAVKDAGIRMAASVGFVPMDWEAIWDQKGDFITGFKFLKSILTEASIVVTPANPNALQLAKSFKLQIARQVPKTGLTQWHRTQIALARARKIILGQSSKH